MIVYRIWTERAHPGNRRLWCDGWYLLGLIPLYVRKFDLDLPRKPGVDND